MIDIAIEEEKSLLSGASLKVLGVGGAGCNAVNWMIESAQLSSVDFIVTNTDAQSLELSPARSKIRLGVKITKGLGAGSNPDLGRRAAEEDLDAIMEHLIGTDILFLTAGLGGGTGTGGLPVIAQAAKELGVLTVAIVTKPFLFEGKRRHKFAEDAVKNLKESVDTLIIVPNQRLLEISDQRISMLDAFALSNDILKQAVKGISDIILKAGHINVDFADVRTIMKDMGMAIMGTGRASGPDRARQAALNAISSPLLENVNIKGAKSVLINITGNASLGLYEINDAAMLIYDMVREDANIILGSVIDVTAGDEVMVTVIATGFEQEQPIEKVYSSAAFARPEQSTLAQNVVPEQPAMMHAQSPFHQTVTASVQEKPVATVAVHTDAESPTQRPVQELSEMSLSSTVDENDLDAPTFLRKNAKLGENSLLND
jgi:cell division protein FtsZ